MLHAVVELKVTVINGPHLLCILSSIPLELNSFIHSLKYEPKIITVFVCLISGAFTINHIDNLILDPYTHNIYVLRSRSSGGLCLIQRHLTVALSPGSSQFFNVAC